MRDSVKSFETLQGYILDLQHKQKNSFLNVINKTGSIKKYSAQRYYEQIHKLAKALIKAGLKKGDKIAILSHTRQEWSVCDLAIIAMGGIVIPLYPNTTSDELTYIINHSDTKLIFLENKTNLRKQLLVKEQCPHLKTIVVFDPPAQAEPGVWVSFNEFVASANKSGDFQNFNFEDLCQQAKPKDTVTIIYTSGTTGAPKGVVLCHEQIITEIIEAFSALQMTEDDHTLTFLPYSHVLGRTEHWGNLIVGYQMTYSTGLDRLTTELKQVKPTIIIGVPRIFEKIYTTLRTKIETSLIEQKLFEWAFHVGTQVNEKQQTQEKIPLKLQSEYLLAQKLFFQRIKTELFGGKLRFALSGGASLSKEIILFFHNCGILILEGYGLTETTGAICVNRTYDYEFGSVGKPLHKTKIKIAGDGEILVQGPTVLKEYYKDSEYSLEQITHQWLHTGDIGEISPSGHLIICDRKKDLIKTANGKYVAPQKIEGLFKQLPFVSYVHVHGDQRSYVVALITLNKNIIFDTAREQNISFKTMEDLKEHPYIKDLIHSAVAQINLSLASHESIKNYAVLTDDFSVESGEITHTLKIRKKIIDQKYKSIIDSLY